VIIKENIAHHEEKRDIALFQTKSMQATANDVKTDKYNFTVYAVYSPSRYNLKKENYLDFLRSLGLKFIVDGDFNVKNTYWGSRLLRLKGKELLVAIQEHEWIVTQQESPLLAYRFL